MIIKVDLVPGKYIELILSGDIDSKEIIAAMIDHYHSGLMGVLWNVAGASLDLNVTGMLAIAHVAKMRATHPKNAYYCPDSLQFGQVRMYQSHAESLHGVTQRLPFRDRDEAIEWLME